MVELDALLTLVVGVALDSLIFFRLLECPIGRLAESFWEDVRPVDWRRKCSMAWTWCLEERNWEGTSMLSNMCLLLAGAI